MMLHFVKASIKSKVVSDSKYIEDTIGKNFHNCWKKDYGIL